LFTILPKALPYCGCWTPLNMYILLIFLCFETKLIIFLKEQHTNGRRPLQNKILRPQYRIKDQIAYIQQIIALKHFKKCRDGRIVCSYWNLQMMTLLYMTKKNRQANHKLSSIFNTFLNNLSIHTHGFTRIRFLASVGSKKKEKK
jgi:adenine specific DNA methylase Mod